MKKGETAHFKHRVVCECGDGVLDHEPPESVSRPCTVPDCPCLRYERKKEKVA
jgi:hypothetical protein